MGELSISPSGEVNGRRVILGVVLLKVRATTCQLVLRLKCLVVSCRTDFDNVREIPVGISYRFRDSGRIEYLLRLNHKEDSKSLD